MLEASAYPTAVLCALAEAACALELVSPFPFQLPLFEPAARYAWTVASGVDVKTRSLLEMSSFPPFVIVMEFRNRAARGPLRAAKVAAPAETARFVLGERTPPELT